MSFVQHCHREMILCLRISPPWSHTSAKVIQQVSEKMLPHSSASVVGLCVGPGSMGKTADLQDGRSELPSASGALRKKTTQDGRNLQGRRIVCFVCAASAPGVSRCRVRVWRSVAVCPSGPGVARNPDPAADDIASMCDAEWWRATDFSLTPGVATPPGEFLIPYG